MRRSPHPVRLSFQAKVLIPVVAIMMLLVVVTMWVVNQQITRQLQHEAAQSLVTAEAVFKNTLGIRTRNLLLRFRNLPNEPRYLAALHSAEPKTIQHFLEDLLGGELDGSNNAARRPWPKPWKAKATSIRSASAGGCSMSFPFP